MTGPILNINVKLDGAEAADSKLKGIEGQSRKTEKATNDLGSSFEGAAKKLAAYVATAFTIERTISTIAGFEKSMSAVQAITRANTEELAALRDVAKELGASTEYSASQAADALKFLGMAGFQAKQAIAAIPDVLDLATASAMGLAQAADISSNIMSGFGLQANQAGQAADILAAAATRANTDVAQLGDAMKYAAPVAHSLGISMGDTAAAIGVMSDAGIQGSQAGTGLRAVLASLVKPSKEGEAALKAMGLTMKDVNPQTKSLSDIFKLLQERGLNAQAAMMLFGREAASAGLSMASASGRLGELSGQLKNVDGEAKRMADTMRNNLQGDLDNLSSAAEGLILALGESGLTTVLRSTIQAVTDLIGVFSEMAVYLPEAALVVGTLATAIGVNFVGSLAAAGLASVSTAASIAGMSTTMGLATLAAHGLGSAIGLLGTAFFALGGPTALVLGAAAYAIYQVNTAADESAIAAEKYSEAIAKAGRESGGASGGIEAASKELFKIEDSANRAEIALKKVAAEAAKARLIADLEAQVRMLGLTMDAVSAAKIVTETNNMIRRFEAGELAAEDMIAEVNKISATHPDASGIVAAISAIIASAAAATGEIMAMNAALSLSEPRDERAKPSDAIIAPVPGSRPVTTPELNFGGGAGKGKGGGGGGGGKSEAEKIADDMKSRLEALKTGLQTEAQAKLEAYVKDMETLKWYLDNKKMTEEEYEAYKDQLQEKAFERQTTEEERQISDYERQLEMLKTFLDQKKITEEEYNQWREQMTADHEQKMREIRLMAYSDALGGIGDLMGAMAGVVGSNNEKMLKAQRIFGAASALISTYVGAAEALKLPFPANLAAMATVLAKGMALVAAIRSGSKSSASGGGGAAGTTNAAAAQEKAPLRQMAEIKLHGEVFGRDQVINLVEKINDVQKDGHVISWQGV